MMTFALLLLLTSCLHHLDYITSKIGRGLDDEVVQTDSRTWRDLKMGITGTIKPGHRDRTASTEAGKSMESGEGSPPRSVFPTGVKDEDKDAMALETVVTVEEE